MRRKRPCVQAGRHLETRPNTEHSDRAYKALARVLTRLVLAMAAYIALTSFVVRGGPEHTMQRAEKFLKESAVTIVTKKKDVLKAIVEHPDGFDCKVSVTYYKGDKEDKLEIVRLSGDGILFSMIYRALAQSFRDGIAPMPLYDGQILPRLITTYSSPPCASVPYLSLDSYE